MKPPRTLSISAALHSRLGLRNISRMARTYWLKNPLIKRAVAVQTLYVWGQGCTMRAVHPTVDAVVQRVLKDPTNRMVFGDVEAQMRLETALQLFGNLFFVFFANPSTGHLKIRTISFDEISAIISNPDDAAHLLYAGDIALLQDPDPAPLLRGEPRRKTGHVIPSRDDGDVTPHLVICVHPDHLYLAVKGEVAAVRTGTLDICKVVSA